MARKTPPKAPAAPPLADVALTGRDLERARLARANADAMLPRVLLLTGEGGIGKQRLALWLAQLILCPEATTSGPCGTCLSCRQAGSLTHPDLLLYLPHASLGSGEANKLVEKAEDARIDLVAERRANALYSGIPTGAVYQLAMIRALKRALIKRAHSAYGRRVVILPEVQLLTPRAGATEPANALLKTLEEPAPGTFFVLTSSVPDRVLATIRSRSIEMPVAPLEKHDVTRILGHCLSSDTDTSEAVSQSGGSVTRALEWLNPDWQDRRQKALQIVLALAAGDRAEAYETVSALKISAARTDLAALLNDVQQLFFQAGALSADTTEDLPIDPRLRAEGAATKTPAAAWTRCLNATLTARRRAEGNVTPQLVLMSLVRTCANAIAA